MLKSKTDRRVLIITLAIILCIVCGMLSLYSCAGPGDPVYNQRFHYELGDLFVPSIYVDSDHDVVCYIYSGQMDCVYVGER